MSIYSELSQQYKTSFAKQQARLHLMANAANAFTVGFERYLGVPDHTWTDSKGEQQRYVRLGVGDENAFQEISYLELSSIGGVIDFSIALTVEQDAHFGLRQVVVFEFSVSVSEENFEFVVKKMPINLSVKMLDKDAHRFDPVYAALVDRLMYLFDPERV